MSDFLPEQYSAGLAHGAIVVGVFLIVALLLVARDDGEGGGGGEPRPEPSEPDEGRSRPELEVEGGADEELEEGDEPSDAEVVGGGPSLV